MSLRSKTVFITGASRGIGHAIAMRAAGDGANIVVTGKTVEPHAKLPGTIHSAAADVERAGGRALAVAMDIRDEEQVERAIAAAADRFGGIDVLVNNASAISLTGTAGTPMKRFDLMHQVNTRGTFMVSKYCIPHLKQAANPHILNISPPLDMSERWFSPHVAYTMAKFGMSMCVLGMAGELKADGIAVNALWPRTGIATAAIRNQLAGDEGMRMCRKPEIMADAAYIVLNKPAREFTGNFCIDDSVLWEAGERDFDKYRVDPTRDLMPDFFVPESNKAPVSLKASKT